MFPKHNLIFSHIPLHPDSLSSRDWVNIHGHTHEGYVRNDQGWEDKRYKCVSVEHTEYKPLLIMT